ncbi:MAG TPA: membrane protein insertase YidC [Pseudomonadales bacterium]
MITAEMQRVLLLVALAATAYLLVLAWNDDYLKVVPSATNTTAPMTTPASAAPQGSADLGHSATDVPVETPVMHATDSTVAVAPTLDVAGRLVRVSTGALEVWIDRLGGDIVRVRLPRFPVSIDQQNDPYVLLDNRSDHVYVAQSGLIGRDGPDSPSRNQRPLYKTAAAERDLADGGEVRLTTTLDNGIEIHKIFGFTANDYLVGVRYEVINHSDAPFEARQFAQLKRDGQDLSAGSSYTLGPKPYLGAALTTADERYHKLTFSSLDDAAYEAPVVGGWIAMVQHYFIGAWVADAGDANEYYGNKRDRNYIVGFKGPAVQVAPHTTGHFDAGFYAGPKDQARLEAIAPNLNLTVDYGFLWWLAVPLFQLLEWLHGVVANWGVAIMLLTLLVKLALYPLSAASYRSMANMRRVAPAMKRLQERYSDDRQKLSQEMMAFYKKEKINPLGGCLPMLLQMPVFIALYWVLFESVELRQAPFFLWIRDLAVMDPYFVLPILMGGSMFLTQALNPPVPDPIQARVMKFMPVIFTVMFLFFPAGLVLYWLVNNLLSVAQQWFITRQVEGAANTSKS